MAIRTLLLVLLVSPCFGAVHFSHSIQGAGTNRCESGGCTTTYSQTVSSGQTSICTVAWFSTFTSLSSSLGNTYNAIGSTQTDSASQSVRLYYSSISSGGSETLTLTTGGFSTLVCDIYTGIPSTPIDQTGGQVGTTSPATCPSITTTQNGELVVAGAVSHGSSAWGAGTGYTLQGSNTGGVNGTPAGLEDQVQSSSGAISAAFSGQGGLTSYACVIASFKTNAGFGNAQATTTSFSTAAELGVLIFHTRFKADSSSGVIFEADVPGHTNASVGNLGLQYNTFGCAGGPYLMAYYVSGIDGNGNITAFRGRGITPPSTSVWHDYVAMYTVDGTPDVFLDGVLQTGSGTSCNFGVAGGGADFCSNTGCPIFLAWGHTQDPNWTLLFFTGSLAETSIHNSSLNSMTTQYKATIAKSFGAGVRPDHVPILCSLAIDSLNCSTWPSVIQLYLPFYNTTIGGTDYSLFKRSATLSGGGAVTNANHPPITWGGAR